jgi:anthranilate synthase/aminodeoxychorismate synthase-like glutamine amidotransferase
MNHLCKHILLIDNHDSFTYNVVNILRNIEAAGFLVISSDNLNIHNLDIFSHIIISPGPMKPADFPVLNDVISYCSQNNKPLLGICLGHQAICEFFGGELVQLEHVVHGQKKRVQIDNSTPVFKNLPSEIETGLYHSWMIRHQTLPECLKITGMAAGQCLMSVKHQTKNIFGLQFHPESFMTSWGKQIFKNFLGIPA